MNKSKSIKNIFENGEKDLKILIIGNKKSCKRNEKIELKVKKANKFIF